MLYGGGTNCIVMAGAETHPPVEMERLPLTQTTVHMRKPNAILITSPTRRVFYHSLDGQTGMPIGGSLKMTYMLAHFMGYRFGLFCFATKTPGGHANFDFSRISDKMIGTN